MKFIILFASLLCIKCSVILHQNIQTPNKDETIIPTEIIGNYLHKYLSSERVFLFIALASSNEQEKYFQQDFVSNLLLHSKLENFSYNILKGIGHPRQGNRKIFYLIFADGIASLR